MYPPHGTKYQKEIEERTVVTWSIFEVNSVIACLELIDFVVELFNPLIRISSSQEFPKIETSGQVLRIFNRLTFVESPNQRITIHTKDNCEHIYCPWCKNHLWSIYSLKCSASVSRLCTS